MITVHSLEILRGTSEDKYPGNGNMFSALMKLKEKVNKGCRKIFA